MLKNYPILSSCIEKKHTLFLCYSLCCLLLFLCSGCFTPHKIVRVAPEQQENIFWHQGQAIAEKKQGSVIVRAAFSHAQHNYLLFDIEVFNEKETPILVTPEALSLITPNDYQIPAIDPEAVILSMEMKASQQEANAKNAAVAGGIIVVGSAVAVAVSSDGGDYRDDGTDAEVIYDALSFTADVVLPTIIWSAQFNQDPILSEYSEALPSTQELIFWQDIVLRRTTLRPGESIRGLVAFPRFDNTAQFELAFPLEKDEFRFLFTQKLYQP